MPPLKGYAALAQKCWDAFEKITDGLMSSYSVLGQTFNKHNLTELADLAERMERKASAQAHGYRSAADISTT